MKKKKKNYLYHKIILAYLFVITISALLFYPTMHRILNYPPGTVDTQFQVDYSAVSYTSQFLAIYLVIALIAFIYIRFFLLRTIVKWEKSDNSSPELVTKVREQCLKIPMQFYIVQLILPFVIILILTTLPFVRHEVNLSGFKIAILGIAIFTFTATLSYTFSKNLFRSILISTYNSDVESQIKFKKNGLVKNIMILLTPLIAVGIFFISLVSYNRVIDERSSDIFSYYKFQLDYLFSTSDTYTYDNILKNLDVISYLEENDAYFIIDNDRNIYTSNNENLTDFYVKYIYELSDHYDGRVYDHYLQDTQGVIKHVIVDSQEYIIGIKYNITSINTIIYLAITFMALVVIISIILLFYSKSLSDQITLINTGFNEINSRETIDFAHRLPVISDDELGELTVAFNKIQDLTKQNIEQIRNNQDMLVEKERLASLGQMIGGIAHNLKTPIMSISGAAEGLTDLINEYNTSIGDKEVTLEDHHEIARDMISWVAKIKTHTSYMSDVITAVKGQAVNFSGEETDSFTIEEFIKRVNVLMKHELKSALIDLNFDIQVNCNLELPGNINSLVQVVNNMISNAIQAYNGETNRSIDLIISKKTNSLVISIKDYGNGMSGEVQSKLFKEMVTTKGKNGTGLGLFMSYSNIKAHFNGDITFESEEGKGTTFNIVLPF